MTAKDVSILAAKILEPTFHFTRKRLGKDDGTNESVVVAELVRPGQVLLDFPDFERFAAKGYEKQPLKAGPHTELSADGLSLQAAAFGYPKVEELADNSGRPVLAVSLIPLVRVSFDKLRAILIIQPTIPGLPGLQNQDLTQLLAEAGIRSGLDDTALAEARRIIGAGAPEISEIVIAEGRPPGPGTDASLSFRIDIGPIAGQLRDDGSIDFRERRIMVGVQRDQLIAVKEPAVPGSPGSNVLGEEIEPKSGRDITVFVQGDAVYSSATNEVRAVKDGVLSVINNNTIKVLAHQVVPGDVDFATGNIGSNGALTINGSIHPGFKVFCAGDLKIGGSVMSASVTTEANAVIKGGITGKKSCITSGGDLDIKFIEQGVIDAGGLVVVRSQAYFSRIRSRSDIRCHPLSKIMGGSLIAAGYLSVGTVGTPKSEPSLLGAGIDPERLDLYEATEQELRTRQDELIQWLQMHGSARSKKVRTMEAAIDETKLRLLTLNLIPGTDLYSRGTKGANRDEVEEISPLYHQGIDIDAIRIMVHGTVHAGCTLLLGNRSLVLPQPVARRQFKLSADMKRIISLPLRG